MSHWNKNTYRFNTYSLTLSCATAGYSFMTVLNYSHWSSSPILQYHEHLHLPSHYMLEDPELVAQQEPFSFDKHQPIGVQWLHACMRPTQGSRRKWTTLFWCNIPIYVQKKNFKENPKPTPRTLFPFHITKRPWAPNSQRWPQHPKILQIYRVQSIKKFTKWLWNIAFHFSSNPVCLQVDQEYRNAPSSPWSVF